MRNADRGNPVSIPPLPELDSLESLTASGEASPEGAWWVTYQVVEHLMGSLSERDKVNHRFLPDLLSTKLDKYEEMMQEKAVRPLPNDRLQQLVNYASQAAENILRKPRSNLVKEEARIRPHQLREMRPKTMHWLNSQPGGTVQQKLAGNKRLAAMVNEFTFETKENRVVAHILYRLGQRVASRLEIGIAQVGAYDTAGPGESRMKELERFQQIVRRKKTSALADVKPSNERIPNNVLLGDRHYSVLWRTNQMLNEYDKLIAAHWHEAFERYVYMQFWAIAAKLQADTRARLLDGLAVAADGGGDFGFLDIGASRIANLRMVVPSSDFGLQWGVVKFINRDKRYGFIDIDGNKCHFTASSLRGRISFDELRFDQVVQVNVRTSDKGVSASEVRTEEQMTLLEVIMESPLRIGVRIVHSWLEGARYIPYEEQSFAYVFELAVRPALRNGRGIAFNASRVDGVFEDHIHHADLGAIRELSDRIAGEACLRFGLPKSEAVRRDDIPEETREAIAEGLAFDFVTRRPALLAEGAFPVEVAREPYNLSFGGRAESPRSGNLYDLALEAASATGIVTGNDEGPYAKAAFGQMLESVRKIGMPQQGYFVYTVPDTVDEFSQRMKAYINAVSKRAYPIWRSIAGATAWRQGTGREINNWNIVVIDTLEESGNAVLLRTKHDDRLGDIVFEHYPPYSLTDEKFPINGHAIEREYIEKFGQAYGIPFTDTQIEHLLRSGKVYDVLVNGNLSIEYTEGSEGPEFIKLFFDGSIYGALAEEWKRRFASYAKALFKDPESGGVDVQTHVHAVVLLGDHIPNAQDWKQELRRLTGCIDVSALTNRDVLEGTLAINRRLKLGLPTWYEYLPDLSLEVVKDGMYDELSLIKNESIQSMGEDKVIQVREKLTLEAGHGDYRFPLVKGNAGKHNADFNAFIRHPSFPLKSDLPVTMSIRYRYGNENSYELTLFPEDRGSAPFDSVIVRWEERDVVHKKDEIPAFPHPAPSEEEPSVRITYLRDNCAIMLRIIESKLESGLPASEDDFRRIKRLLSGEFLNSLFKVLHSRAPETAQWFDMFNGSMLVRYFADLVGGHRRLLPEYYLSAVSDGSLADFRMKLIRTLCLFGNRVTSIFYRELAIANELEDRYRMDGYSGLLIMDDHIDSLIDDMLEEYKLPVRRTPMIRSLRRALWKKDSLIGDIYETRPELIIRVVDTIEREFSRLSSRTHIRPFVATLYRDYCEVLLGILRLRKNEGFSLLKTGSTRAAQLAKHIRKLDRLILTNGFSISSDVKLAVKKPPVLDKMSDLGFALNNYLTGDRGTNLIQVIGFDGETE